MRVSRHGATGDPRGAERNDTTTGYVHWVSSDSFNQLRAAPRQIMNAIDPIAYTTGTRQQDTIAPQFPTSAGNS